MLKKIREFFKKSEKGQGVVEYVLILGVVALIAAALLTNDGLADKVVGAANTMGENVESQVNAVTALTVTPVAPNGGT